MSPHERPSKTFDEIATPAQVDYDDRWRKANDEVFSMAQAAYERGDYMQSGILAARFSELEKPRLAWKLGVFRAAGLGS